MSMVDDTDLHEHQCENEVCGVVYSCSDPHCDTHFKYCPSCAELLGTPGHEDREELNR